MKRSLTMALAVALLAIAFAAAPVAAATPYEVTLDTTYTTFVNPCTGLTNETTFHEVYLVTQDTESRWVTTLEPSKTSAYTSDGYTLVSGNETIAFNTNGGISDPTVALLRNADDGSMYIYRQMIRYNEATQQLVVLRASFTCLGQIH